MYKHACLMGVNVIVDSKRKHAMTNAWSTMVGYDKMIILIGEQSDTGKKLEQNDIIYFSALSSSQEAVAKHFGDEHSSSINKFTTSFLDKEERYVLDAKTHIELHINKILHLPGIEGDNLLYCEIVAIDNDESKTFLSLTDIEK